MKKKCKWQFLCNSDYTHAEVKFFVRKLGSHDKRCMENKDREDFTYYLL